MSAPPHSRVQARAAEENKVMAGEWHGMELGRGSKEGPLWGRWPDGAINSQLILYIGVTTLMYII